MPVSKLGDMARPSRSKPRELSPGWPNEKSPDQEAEVARRVAIALQAAIGDRSYRDVEKITHVHNTTLRAIVVGATWPDLTTIARLEEKLDIDLWPRRPR